jgi:putative hydrolase of the HAD superfamily
MNVKTIFFDVYHTLVSVNYNGNEEAWDIFSKFLNSRGVIIDIVQFKNILSQEKQKYYFSVKDPEMKFRHHNLFDLINAIFLNYNIEVDKKELFDLIWQFRQLHHPEVNLYPGVKDILHELSLKYTLSVASYTQGSYTHKELEKLGIAQCFSHFIFSSDIGYRKTDQEFYKICLQKTNSNPEECLMIGDNYLQDVVIPKKLGLRAILIENLQTNKQNVINDVKPDGIVKLEDISTLPLIIQSIL